MLNFHTDQRTDVAVSAINSLCIKRICLPPVLIFHLFFQSTVTEQNKTSCPMCEYTVKCMRELSAHYQQQSILKYLIQGLLTKISTENYKDDQPKTKNFPQMRKINVLFINSSWCASSCCCIVCWFWLE